MIIRIIFSIPTMTRNVTSSLDRISKGILISVRKKKNFALFLRMNGGWGSLHINYLFQ